MEDNLFVHVDQGQVKRSDESKYLIVVVATRRSKCSNWFMKELKTEPTFFTPVAFFKKIVFGPKKSLDEAIFILCYAGNTFVSNL